MPDVAIRKTLFIVEEIVHEGGPAPTEPLRRGAVVAVNRNRADELALVLVMTTGARVHRRAGGLQADAIIGEDGLQ